MTSKCCKMWVNQRWSELHFLCIVIIVFLYLTKPFPPFIDRWKSPCAFLLWGYCMSLDSPQSLTRLLFWHALYRLKPELRVHRQNCPLRSSFQKMAMNGGSINQKTTSIQSWNWPKKNVTAIQNFPLFQNASAKNPPKSGQCRDCIMFTDTSPEWTRGRSCQQRRHKSPTVKSGPHQTWSCPQHASRISLFVLQILSSSSQWWKDDPIVLFYSHKCKLSKSRCVNNPKKSHKSSDSQ